MKTFSIILLLLLSCSLLKAQPNTKGKEFYLAIPPPVGYEGVFILSSDTVTKGTIILYRGGIWADTIPFIIQTPHQPTHFCSVAMV